MIVLIGATFFKGLSFDAMSWRTLITPTQDGNVLLLNYGAYVKISPTGNVIQRGLCTGTSCWLKILLSYPSGYLINLEESHDEGFLLLDPDLNARWYKKFQVSGYFFNYVFDVVWDGSHFATVVKLDKPAVMKIDTLGNVIWAFRFPNLGTYADAITAVGGHYFIAAQDTSDTVIVFALDSNDGSVYWAKKLGFVRDYSWWGWRIMRLAKVGSDIVLFHKRGILIRMDTLGNVLWSKKIQNVSAYDLEVHGEHIYLAGYPAHIAKLDTSGSVIWSRRYDVSPWSGSTIYDLTLVGGYVYAAVDVSAMDTAIIVKADTSNGNTSCYYGHSINVIDTTLVSRLTSIMQQPITVTTTDQAWAPSSFALTIFDACTPTGLSEASAPTGSRSGIYYDASGRCHRGKPGGRGVYFVPKGGGWRKVIER